MQRHATFIAGRFQDHCQEFSDHDVQSRLGRAWRLVATAVACVINYPQNFRLPGRWPSLVRDDGCYQAIKHSGEKAILCQYRIPSMARQVMMLALPGMTEVKIWISPACWACWNL